MMRKKKWQFLLAGVLLGAGSFAGCGGQAKDGKVEIELVHYKPEAVDLFAKLEEKFNSTHDNIHLTISSPNDAMTILKTRFVREDYPDILGIGGILIFPTLWILIYWRTCRGMKGCRRLNNRMWTF